jgi:diguanylate cyclase (GGDEF)-like protein
MGRVGEGSGDKRDLAPLSGAAASLAGQLRRTFLLIGGLVGVAFVATALLFFVGSVHYAIAGGVGLELAICTSLILLALRQHRALRDAIVVAESRDALVRQHANRLRQILDASREFSESLDLPYVVRSVSSNTMAVGGYDQVVVWLMADDQRGLREAGLTGSAPVLDETRDDTLAWRAAKSGRMTFEGLDGRVRLGDGGAAPVRARAVPLIVGARVIGALEARHLEPRAPSGEDLEILVMLASQAATALESARVNQIAEEKSLTDPLTRLHNRRRLEEDLDDECNRCTRYGRPLAFVMLDVDNFKAFNDAHGHSSADVALQEVARVIGTTVRATDSAYRYGGEEFCVLLRETGAENAMHFAERLRERIEARFANDSAPRITASFGVAEVSVETAMPRALLDAADAAMYESKRTGRNRVLLSTPPSRSSSGAIAIARPLQTAESSTVPRAMTALAEPERKTSG